MYNSTTLCCINYQRGILPIFLVDDLGAYLGQTVLDVRIVSAFFPRCVERLISDYFTSRLSIMLSEGLDKSRLLFPNLCYRYMINQRLSYTNCAEYLADILSTQGWLNLGNFTLHKLLWIAQQNLSSSAVTDAKMTHISRKLCWMSKLASISPKLCQMMNLCPCSICGEWRNILYLRGKGRRVQLIGI